MIGVLRTRSLRLHGGDSSIKWRGAFPARPRPTLASSRSSMLRNLAVDQPFDDIPRECRNRSAVQVAGSCRLMSLGIVADLGATPNGASAPANSSRLV
jgi:hypothetical protein